MTIATEPARQRGHTRARRDRVTFVEVPTGRYLAIDGNERPGSQTFQNAISTLYPVAYSLHFLLKQAGTVAPVGTIEGIFWPPLDDQTGGQPGNRASGSRAVRWRLVMPVPAVATEEDIEEAIRHAAASRALPALSRLHAVAWHEGPSAQMLHVGPYAAEEETIGTLRDAIVAAGYEVVGPHHEIYLNDPHRVGEANAKTIVRLPVRPLAGRVREEVDDARVARV